MPGTPRTLELRCWKLDIVASCAMFSGRFADGKRQLSYDNWSGPMERTASSSSPRTVYVFVYYEHAGRGCRGLVP